MKKIVVIGSINTDMVVRTSHIPQPGETIMGNSFFVTGGGKGANQAVAAAKLGGLVYLIAKVGNDVFGQQAIDHLTSIGVDTTYVQKDIVLPSGVALIAVAESGENSIIVAPGANDSLALTDIVSAREVLREADYILLQLEIPVPTVEFAVQLAKEYNKKIILNPAPATLLDDALLKQVDILIPNQSEAQLLTGIAVADEDSAAKAAEQFHQKGIHTVIITMGEQGCFVSDAAFKGMVKGHRVERVVDTVAAGDTFCGALSIGLSEGMSIDTAAKFANIAAALAVTRQGAQASIPLREEVHSIFSLKH